MDIRTKQYLEKEIPNFKREIQTLYKKFDKELGLHGADVAIKFGFDDEVLGSYTPEKDGEKEHFYFSLFFIGFCNKDPMHKSDKIDLYAHEYAHYMQYNMDIPKEHLWQPGKHGSAWKYCCSLVNAAPTPYYKIGEGLKKHNYDKALKNPWADKNYSLMDTMKEQKKIQMKRDSIVQYSVGDEVEHPKFGKGIVQAVEQTDGAVRLSIKFDEDIKKIDQKWLLKTNYKTTREREQK